MTRQEERSVEECDSEPTEEELEASRQLRDALNGQGEHADAELARALQCAFDPRDLSQLEHQALVNRAVSRHAERKRGRIAAALGTATALALAAGLALLLSRGIIDQSPRIEGQGTVAAASLVRSRSTQPLFGEPFPAQGGSSGRIDRIAQARSRDYRANLFERLGVR